MEQQPTSDKTTGLSDIEEAFKTLRSLAGTHLVNEEIPEKTRKPFGEELTVVTAHDCIVLTKRSMLQYDMDTKGKNFVEVVESYQQEGVPQKRIQAIIDSHNAQRSSYGIVDGIFKDAGISEKRIFILDHLKEEEIQALVTRYPVVIALGGDDHIKAVSRYVTDKNYLVTVNSDQERSNGVMTYFSASSMPALFERFQRGEFLIEEWPRLEVSLRTIVDEKEEILQFPLCISEVSIADKSSLYTFRGTILRGDTGDKIAVKGSGILFTTGAGSTGWFSSAARFLYPLGRKYNRTDPHGEFIIREPYGDIDGPLTGTFDAGTKLVIQTSSKHSPEISGDSIWVHHLTPGTEVHIRLKESSIKIIQSR